MLCSVCCVVHVLYCVCVVLCCACVLLCCACVVLCMCCVVLCCVVHVLCCTCDVLCCVFFFFASLPVLRFFSRLSEQREVVHSGQHGVVVIRTQVVALLRVTWCLSLEARTGRSQQPV